MEEKVAKSTELEEFLRETSLKPGIINPILKLTKVLCRSSL
jgi:tRNA uridine 5-carboxymethylaminomethyl modification enzyme